MVRAELRPMTEAQIANAKGLKFIKAREKKTGKFKHLTEKEVSAVLSGEQESEFEMLEIWEERPNVQAFTDLLNRTLDKPTEHFEGTMAISGLGDRIKAAQERLRGK